jgi:aspartyl/asparaginyl beta-hydroxylase (cupin superfamily)
MGNENDVEPWFRFSGKPFQANDPAWFDTNHFSWHRQTELAFPELKKEIESFIATESAQLKEYRFNPNPPRPQWLTFPLISWAYIHQKNLQKLPLTARHFLQYPELVSVSLSCLTAGSEVSPHHGDTNAIFRCHFGIRIPATLPECGFRVKGDCKPWQEGKLFAFCDAHLHDAFNHTKEDRYILIIDAIRPEYYHRRREICSLIISSHLWYMAENKIPLLRSLKPSTSAMLIKWCSIPVRILLRS